MSSPNPNTLEFPVTNNPIALTPNANRSPMGPPMYNSASPIPGPPIMSPYAKPQPPSDFLPKSPQEQQQLFMQKHTMQNGPASIHEANMNGRSQVNGFSGNQSPYQQDSLQRTPYIQGPPGQNLQGPPRTGNSFLGPQVPNQNISPNFQGPPPTSQPFRSPSYAYGGPSPQTSVDGRSPHPVPSPTGLPLPYGGVGTTETTSPQITPGTSQPPSEKSSRNPSPIPLQRYDYMEGQFSNRPSPSGSSTNLSANTNPASWTPNSMQGGPGFPAPGTPFVTAASPLAPQPGFSPRPPPGPMLQTPQTLNSFGPTSPLHPPPDVNSIGPMSPLQPPPNTNFIRPPSSLQPPRAPNALAPVSPQQPHTPGYPGGPPLTPQMGPMRYPSGGSPLPPMQPSNMSGPPLGGVPHLATPHPATPQPGAIRQRYPQQPGFGHSPSQFPSPMPSQGGGMPPTANYGSSPSFQPQSPYQGGLPDGPVGGAQGYDPSLHAKMAGMSVHQSFSKLWGTDSINLLQDRNILPPLPLEPPKPVLTPEKPNCSPNIFRSTLTKIPDTNTLLQKSRLPFGILIHPFRDTSGLSVVQCNSIVRCRSCRTYINPFISFIDQRRWKCNLCYRINDLPEEFLYDPVTRSYGDPSRRPEIRNATIEFIAPSDYMVRPPQPAVYLFLLDVSHAATETGYLETFCKVLLENLDKLPGDSRTQIGFITFDGSIHFYNLGEGINQPHMLVISDIEDVFLPSPDNLLVNIHESKSLIIDLLNDLPNRFASNGNINSCLGAALQVAYKLMSPVGGRVTVVQTSLPNYGPGSLVNREDPNQRAGKEVSNIGPASDFYKKLALDCTSQQIGVDLFLLCSQYVDVATLSGMSKYSSGNVHYYPGYHCQLGKMQVEKFAGDLKRYLTRRIGFEAVMRIRCTKGLALHTFHGNFFVRSTDLLALPNVSPDCGYGMQIAIEENLSEFTSVCFQAAVLYTSTVGERRIRVHTLCVPVVSVLQDVITGADQETIIGIVCKMAADRSLTSLSDARDALINVCVDVLGVYKAVSGGQVAGALMSSYSTRLIPLFILALLKHVAFRSGVCTKLDERVFAMERMKSLPLTYLMKYIYPTLYPVHALDEKNAIHQDDDVVIPQPVILQLSSEKLDRHGAYILDTLDVLYLFIGRAISDHFCNSVLNVPNFGAISENLVSLPVLPTPESERLRAFVTWLQDQQPFHCALRIIREDSKDRHLFLQHMLDDRTESLFSYYEFLQHIRQQVTK